MPVDPCGLAVFMGSAAGRYRAHFWAGDTERVAVIRTYRVPDSTPFISIPHAYYPPEPGDFEYPTAAWGRPGILLERPGYDRGARPAWWAPGPSPCGRPEAWLDGGVEGVDAPLTFLEIGASTCCLGKRGIQWWGDVRAEGGMKVETTYSTARQAAAQARAGATAAVSAWRSARHHTAAVRAGATARVAWSAARASTAELQAGATARVAWSAARASTAELQAGATAAAAAWSTTRAAAAELRAGAGVSVSWALSRSHAAEVTVGAAAAAEWASLDAGVQVQAGCQVAVTWALTDDKGDPKSPT